MDSGTYGEIWLAAIMTAGGVAGSGWMLSQATTGEARRFLVPRLLLVWLSLIVMGAVTYVTPRPFSFLVWLCSLVAVGSVAVRWWQRFWALQQAESGSGNETPPLD